MTGLDDNGIIGGMSTEYRYIFGPVTSRRLGQSLGVDPIPLKTCTYNCLYCQLGRESSPLYERSEYADVDAAAEVALWAESGGTADYITLSGSGEPTLNAGLGGLIDALKAVTDIPIAVITNGSLLFRPDVRADLMKADLVAPSLDAGDEETWRRINRPHPGIAFEDMTEGLIRFREEFPGRLWLEVFLIEGINTSEEQVSRIAALAERINPERIQLNTAVRPAADPSVSRLSPERMDEIAGMFTPRAEIIAGDSPRTVLGAGNTTFSSES